MINLAVLRVAVFFLLIAKTSGSCINALAGRRLGCIQWLSGPEIRDNTINSIFYFTVYLAAFIHFMAIAPLVLYQ